MSLRPNAWGIQVASLPDRQAARTELRRVRAAYWPPPEMEYRIVEDMLEGGTVYRIHLGPFDSQAAALDHCSRLKEAGRDRVALSPGA